MERVQLSIARAILKWQRQSHSNAETLQCIGWPTLYWRRRRAKLAMFWQLLNGGGPPSLQAVACRTAEARMSYSLRNKLGVEFPSCLSASLLRSFLPSVIALWNSLPTEVSSCKCLSSFLCHLDKFYVSDRFSFGLS